MKYYNNEKEISSDEAHALKDKTGLVVSDGEVKFKKKEVVKKKERKNANG